VGYDEGGQLTEAVRRRPYSVLLLDEIEKAHPDVFNILLQVLDDGRLTDSKGVTVNFRNTIIIMTSNLGSQLIQRKIDESGGKMDAIVYDELQAALLNQLRQTIRPEFLNRIDDVIVFHPLSKEHLRLVVDIQLRRVLAMLGKQGITLHVPDSVKDWLAAKGYDPTFGARPLKRLIQTQVVNRLATMMLMREADTKAQYDVRISRDAERLDFAEVFDDVTAWAEE
jgi:ATP-dependent Clp protease ATP-binding subunit ClpB